MSVSSGWFGLLFGSVFLLALILGDLGSLGREVTTRRAALTRTSTLVGILAAVPLIIFMVLRFIDLAA